jgi:CHAD domain-containing protein
VGSGRSKDSARSLTVASAEGGIHVSGTESNRNDVNPSETGKQPQQKNSDLGLRDGQLTLESLDAERKRSQRAGQPSKGQSRGRQGNPKALSQSRRTIPELSVPTPRPTAATRKSGSKAKGGAFAFRQGKPFQADLGRIVSRQLDKALRDLCRLGATADEAIHNVRKRFKRVRAVLRLVRGELGAGLYRKENESLRDAAAAFSEVRNARVLVDAVEKLRRRDGDVPPAAFDALSRFLKARQRDIHDRLARNVEAMDDLREAIERGRSRATEWPLPGDGRRAVRRGLRRSCKAGSKALDEAEKETTSETLHECRKQAKYLYHQVQLLQRVGSPDLVQLAEQLHELEEKLGDDHDLGMLRVEVAACVAGGLPDVNERVLALIDEWRKELQTHCLGLAQKIYREDAATVRHRFRDCSKQLIPKKR